ncbi:hypothetical protein E8E12_010453 [Didymella heteroderae]|uniref:Sequence-specific DNA binding RNA polymerase II transcription factor n=1 Tax=Didymella heteroderae TaxID=1769908 RepID=A0A9P4WYD2_9PLEO|nr:hypothetical protein E8E12_010453 [Didymella heteroderae]
MRTPFVLSEEYHQNVTDIGQWYFEADYRRHANGAVSDDSVYCDFQRPSCSSCSRVSASCVGYRDTENIRIADETDDVRTKAVARSSVANSSQITYLAPDMGTVARDMFFADYVCNFSQTWDILLKYSNSITMPEHLALSLDAVSLAFMAHNTGSTRARDLSRKKYVAALRTINMALQDAESARNASTFEGAILLDLFEEMTKSFPEDAAPRHAHVEGALALVNLRGIGAFQEGPELRSLLGLSLNATICCLTTRTKVSEPIRAIREHLAQSVNTESMNWKLSNVLMDVLDLIADIRTDLAPETKAARCTILENRLETIANEAPPVWSYERVVAPPEHRKQIFPDDLPPLYDTYPNRAVLQTWNVLRLLRILVYEELVSHCPMPAVPTKLPQTSFITPTIQQICATVPHITDCSLLASHRLPPGSPGQHSGLPFPGPPHTIPHILEAFILIFPLYVAAWSRYCSSSTRDWILDQLKHIATHFGIPEAGIVRDILLREVETRDNAISWLVRRKQFDYVLLRHVSAFYGLSL